MKCRGATYPAFMVMLSSVIQQDFVQLSWQRRMAKSAECLIQKYGIQFEEPFDTIYDRVYSSEYEAKGKAEETQESVINRMLSNQEVGEE